MKIFKKAVSSALALTLVLSMTGCNIKKVGKENNDGKIHVTIGGSPTTRTDTNAAEYDLFQENKKRFEKENPDIEITPDSWSFDIKNYLTKAAAGDLPTMFFTSVTELKSLAKQGYIKDVTKIAEKYGYEEGLNHDQYQHLYKVDGKYYALVKEGSVGIMGIAYNINVFKKAGLIDDDGLPIFPQTWEELAETAKIIKDKTGKTGFAITTKNNQGGWHFINLLWAFGSDIMKEKDGKYVATFADDGGVDALKYIKDLKWKYNVLQEEPLSDVNTCGQLFATDEVGMILTGPGQVDQYVKNYGLNIKNVAMSRMPEGPAGRYSQLSSHIWVFTGTDEENEACFKWLDSIGQGVKVNDVMKDQWEKNYKIKADYGYAVGAGIANIWKDKTRTEAEETVAKKYATIDPKNYADFYSGKDVSYRSEPPACAQQFYSVMDSCIQAVLTDKNADCKALMKQAQKDFQVNYLDKE